MSNKIRTDDKYYNDIADEINILTGENKKYKSNELADRISKIPNAENKKYGKPRNHLQKLLSQNFNNIRVIPYKASSTIQGTDLSNAQDRSIFIDNSGNIYAEGGFYIDGAKFVKNIIFYSEKSIDFNNIYWKDVKTLDLYFPRSSFPTLINFDTSHITDMYGMFANSNNLISLDLSSFNTSNVTDMGSMFFSCTSLTSLDLSNFNTSNVTNMTDMFANCTSLTSLDISNFDTSNATNMTDMFRNCTSLTSLDLSNFDTSKVTNMYGMFTKCTSLTSLDLSSFNTSNVTDMEGMFAGCTSLTSLDLSSFDTSNVTNMNQFFAVCTSLKTVYCRSQNDINKFKATSPPANINFILK